MEETLKKQNRRTIDTYLQHRNRTLRTRPGKLLLGSTGARLFADYLDPVPGFIGRIDFIHKLNLPGIFTVSCNEVWDLEPLETIWYPSHLYMKYTNADLAFEEYKFITWNDIAVSCQSWTNKSSEDYTLQFQILDTWEQRQEDGGIYINRDCQSHNLRLNGYVYSDSNIHAEGTLKVPSGSSVSFVIIAVISGECEKDKNVQSIAKKYINSEKEILDYKNRQVAEYDGWFDKVPVFHSDDALLNKTWWYRWFLLRHNYAEPSMGNMKHGVFYEGRSHKTAKDLYQPKGHEFTQLIPLSTPMHIVDCRWRQDDKECREALLSLIDSMDQNYIFHTMMIDRMGTVYGNYAEWAFYQYALVHKDKDFIRLLLPMYKENVRGVLRSSKNNKDNLPICYDHRRTGKEYQPSFWYFNDYPDNAKDNDSFTYLKRVDLAIYLYLNALGTAKLCEMIKDSDGAEFYALAEDLKVQVLSKMWDEKSGFFYDLHHETGEKAYVKNVVGIYPLWAEINDDSHLKILDYYFSSQGFATGSAFASVSKDCPVYYPQGSWKGNFFKGRDGCMWDGPSWPYTTSIVLDAIAKQSKKNGHAYDKEFAKYFKQYSLQHYRNHNLEEPYLVEHYNSETGEMLSDEVDYLHSYYIDLVIRHIVGFCPSEEGICIEPVDIGLCHFTLDNLMVQGKKYRIEYKKMEYYRVFHDEKIVFESKELPLKAVRLWQNGV